MASPMISLHYRVWNSLWEESIKELNEYILWMTDGSTGVGMDQSFCTPVLSAVQPYLPLLACSIRWYDLMNVQWSPMRPLIWTLFSRWWWYSSCGQGQTSPCGNEPFYLPFFFLAEQFSSVLQHYSACHHTNYLYLGFIDFFFFLSDVITKHYSWFCQCQVLTWGM